MRLYVLLTPHPAEYTLASDYLLEGLGTNIVLQCLFNPGRTRRMSWNMESTHYC